MIWHWILHFLDLSEKLQDDFQDNGILNSNVTINASQYLGPDIVLIHSVVNNCKTSWMHCLLKDQINSQWYPGIQLYTDMIFPPVLPSLIFSARLGHNNESFYSCFSNELPFSIVIIYLNPRHSNDKWVYQRIGTAFRYTWGLEWDLVGK